MTDTVPREGACMKCRRRLPLFEFECIHAEFWQTDSHDLWLCVHDWSKAKGIDEDGRDACEELEIDTEFDPWIPSPRTAREQAQAYGPIGKIRSFEHGREVTP